MELIWKELPGEHMIYSGIAQAAVEGDIPVPATGYSKAGAYSQCSGVNPES